MSSDACFWSIGLPFQPYRTKTTHRSSSNQSHKPFSCQKFDISDSLKKNSEASGYLPKGTITYIYIPSQKGIFELMIFPSRERWEMWSFPRGCFFQNKTARNLGKNQTIKTIKTNPPQKTVSFLLQTDWAGELHRASGFPMPVGRKLRKMSKEDALILW